MTVEESLQELIAALLGDAGHDDVRSPNGMSIAGVQSSPSSLALEMASLPSPPYSKSTMPRHTRAEVNGGTSGVSEDSHTEPQRWTRQRPPSLNEDIERLLQADRRTQPFVVDSIPGKPKVKDDSSTSALATVGRTAALATGVGPLVTGLLSIFGSGRSDSRGSGPEQELWAKPARIDIDAGLAADRSIQQLSYSAEGNARFVALNPPAPTAAPTVQIQVNAMDSRSFLDHSDEIARAVRDAMLRSSQLSDVMAEL